MAGGASDDDGAGMVFVIVAAAFGGLLLALVWIYVFGCAPRFVLKMESRVIRSFKRRKRWSWDYIEQHLILGALPRWPCHLEELKAEGIGAVLSLNEQWEMAMSPTCIQEDCGMDHRQLPTPDFFPPTQKDLVEAVAFISKHIKNGTGVYVHCNAGKGRSACCVICYLMYAHGWTAQEAFDHVKERRRIAKLPMLCGTRAQWRAIRTFGRALEKVRRQVAPAPDSQAFLPGEQSKSGAPSAAPSAASAPPVEVQTAQPPSGHVASLAAGEEQSAQSPNRHAASPTAAAAEDTQPAPAAPAAPAEDPRRPHQPEEHPEQEKEQSSVPETAVPDANAPPAPQAADANPVAESKPATESAEAHPANGTEDDQREGMSREASIPFLQ